MVDLGRHIEILLLENDCVIVPGLGGFVAHHVEAGYDRRDGMFLPPSRTLGFNPKLKLNDSLLVQSYIETYDISYPEALERINNEVSEICQSIDNEGGYEIEGVGTLTTGDNGSYEFVPCEAGILTPELYGLYSLEISDLATAKGKVRDKGRLSTGILAAAAAIIIFVILFFSPSFGDDANGIRIVSADWKSPVSWFANLKLSWPAPSAGNTEDSAPAAADTTAVAMTDTTAVPMAEPEEVTPYYTIVLACRIPVGNAENYAEKMTGDGYDNVTVLGEGKNIKVIYGRFETEGKAYSTLNRLRSRRPFAEAWVYKVER